MASARASTAWLASVATVLTLGGCALFDQQDVPVRRAPIVSVPVQPSAAPTASEIPKPRSRAARRRDDDRPDTYVVQKGDTLYGIALEFGHDWRELAAANGLTDPSRILVGQRLRLELPDEPATVRPLPNAAGRDVRAEPIPADGGAATLAATGSDAKPGVGPATGGATVASPGRTADGVPILSEPRARTLPYSDKLLAELDAADAGGVNASRAVATAAPTAPAATAATAPNARSAEPRAPSSATVPSSAAPTTMAVPSVPPAPARPGDRIAPVMEPDGGTDWVWPTRGTLAYRFGTTGQLRGVGIAGKVGQPVSASAPGRVVYAGSGVRGYGNMVIVRHDDAFFSVYAHNADLLVRDGDVVRRGQRIATMGAADAGRAELHFEIRKFGKPVDPLDTLPGERPPG